MSRREACPAQTVLELVSGRWKLLVIFSADYLLDEWPEALLAHAANATIPVFVVSAVAAHPQASRGAGAGQSIA